MCDDKKTKKYIAMLKTMIAYDEMNDYLDDFIKNHQDDNLIEQIRLLQDYNIMLQHHDELFECLILRHEYDNSRTCLLCKKVYLYQAASLARKIAESVNDFDTSVHKTLEYDIVETGHIMDVISYRLDV